MKDINQEVRMRGGQVAMKIKKIIGHTLSLYLPLTPDLMK